MGTITWIKCSERMPETPRIWYEDTTYLTFSENEIVQMLTYTEAGWNTHHEFNGSIYAESKIDGIVAWAYINLPDGLEGEQDE